MAWIRSALQITEASPIPRRLQLAIISCILALMPISRAHAAFEGYYSPNNWKLTNTDGGNGAGTNGTVMTPDGGNSIVVTGGNSGSGQFGGTTDVLIQAPIAGTIQFHFVYFSRDESANAVSGLGCGAGAMSPCDHAGYLLYGQYTPLADDANQLSGNISVAVNSGDSFGFRVVTDDNQGEPGILTISGFSGPAPAPTAVNVSSQVSLSRTGFLFSPGAGLYFGTLTVTNTSSQSIVGPIQIALANLPAGISLVNANVTGGIPFVTVPGIGSLAAGASAKVEVQFTNPANVLITFTPIVYSGSF